MRAIIQSRYGSAEDLRLAVVERPVPGDGDALVRVYAASVNDWDWQLLAGRPFLNRVNGAGGLRGPRHPIPGCDIAGVVVEVGAKVVEVAVGDEVMADLSGCGFGAFADFACAPAHVLRRKPTGLSWVETAAVPQAGSLAVRALRTGGPVQPKQAVLVNGAGGGVGTFAVQIAAWSGAEVTGVDSGDKLDAVRAVGAQHVIDYARTDFTSVAAVYDRIVEPVARRSPGAYRRVLRAGGVCAIVGGSLRRVAAAALVGGLTNKLSGRSLVVPLWRPNDAVDVAFLTGLLETGAVRPVVDRVFRLAEASQALQHFGATRHIGKIVLTTE
ncbi:MAG TPA: NAD(P)-dependent alcohol dehydrogenase [Microlunatus sp.]